MKRLEELALRWMDGELTEAEAGELDVLLVDGEDAVRLVALVELEFALRGAAHEVDVVDKVMQTVGGEVGDRIAARVMDNVKHGARRDVLPFGAPVRVGNTPGATGRAGPWRWVAALAASLAVLAAGSLIYRSIFSQPPPGTANIAQHNGHSERRVVGHIAEVMGTVAVRVGDEAMPVAATPGMTMFEGSRVLTGDGDCRCRLALATGDVVITVSGDSELMLKGGGADRQYDSEVNMTRGELQAEVRRKGTRFAVVSVAGRAEAIGTEFKVKLQEQTEEKESKMNKTQMSMLTTVLSGVVLISNPFGTMTARAGEAVTVTPVTAPAKQGDRMAEWAALQKTRAAMVAEAEKDPAVAELKTTRDSAMAAYKELYAKKKDSLPKAGGQDNPQADPELASASKKFVEANAAYEAAIKAKLPTIPGYNELNEKIEAERAKLRQ